MKFLNSIIIVLAFCLSSPLFSQEKSSLYLGYCNHFGTGVSYTFSSCVNSNFSSISYETQSYYQSCTNFSTEVDYFFTSCINSNFRNIQRQLGNTVYLPDCMNFDRKNLDYSFVSCVNSNFNSIQRELAVKP